MMWPSDLARRLLFRLGVVRRGVAHPDPDDIVTPDERWNSKMLALEAPFGMAALGAVPSFLALYIIQLGGSNIMVGWLTSGPALISLLWLIPCGRIIQHCRDYRTPLAIGIGFHRLSLVFLAFVPLLSLVWRPWGVVILIALSALPGTLWGMSHQVACGEMFQPRHMARLLSRRWAAMNVSNVVLMLLLGKLIDFLPFPLNFQVLFAGGGILTLVSIWFMLRLKLPPREEAEPEVSPR